MKKYKRELNNKTTEEMLHQYDDWYWGYWYDNINTDEDMYYDEVYSLDREGKDWYCEVWEMYERNKSINEVLGLDPDEYDIGFNPLNF